MDLKFTVNKHFDIFRKIAEMIEKFSPFPTKLDQGFEIEHIPIEISRILQKVSYQITIDNSRLVNKLKDELFRLAKSSKMTLEKYTLRDRGIRNFVQEFDEVVNRIKENEFYDTQSERYELANPESSSSRGINFERQNQKESALKGIFEPS